MRTGDETLATAWWPDQDPALGGTRPLALSPATGEAKEKGSPEARVETPHPFFRYSTEICAWRLGQPQAVAALPVADAAVTASRTARVLRAATSSRQVVLLGGGTGDLAVSLAASLPESTSLAVVCADPERARQLITTGKADFVRPDGNRQLLVDASAMALFVLAVRHGLDLGTALVTVNPEGASPDEARELAVWRRLWRDTRTAEAPLAASPLSNRPTLALLARPDEPDLDAFFRSMAGLAERAVVLWDAVDVPEAAQAASGLEVPVRHLARPLAGDFAAQRNVLLNACPEGWVLSLDPDERPGPGFADTLGRLLALPDLGGVFFPRLTLHPDGRRVLAGYGLWPDVQLRLFRHVPGRVRYVRPVHERLEGLSGRAALALDAPLVHGNRVLADDRAVTHKLAAYSAVPGAARHCLSADYPGLPLDFFRSPPGLAPGGRVLLPPPMW